MQPLMKRVRRKARSILFPRRTPGARAPGAPRAYEDQGGVVHRPEPDAPGSDAGIFFRYSLTHIPAGRHVVRHAVQFPLTGATGEVTLVCTLDGEPVASRTAAIDGDLDADAIDMDIDLPRQGLVEFTGRVSQGVGRTHLRMINVHERHAHLKPDYRAETVFDVWPPQSIRDVIIGTTGVCNASCPHCPSNKPMLAGRAQAPMDWNLYTRLIDQLAESNPPVEGQIAFGLFGDGLMDPQVVERARYAKLRLPHVSLVINTNAGPFNERRHAELAEIADCFSVHVEALDPAIYARLMAPLRAEMVFPKIDRLIELAPGKVHIVTPISTANIAGYAEMRRHWEDKGAVFAHMTISNRTTDNLDFYSYAFAPTSGVCRQEASHDLVVDWDGKVLGCCQDFTRGNEVGDLTQQSVVKAMRDDRRREMFDGLAEGRWSRFESCRNCKFDSGEKLRALLEEARA